MLCVVRRIGGRKSHPGVSPESLWWASYSGDAGKCQVCDAHACQSFAGALKLGFRGMDDGLICAKKVRQQRAAETAGDVCEWRSDRVVCGWWLGTNILRSCRSDRHRQADRNIPWHLLCRRMLVPTLPGKYRSKGIAAMTFAEIAPFLVMPVGGLLIGLWALYFARTITKNDRNH